VRLTVLEWAIGLSGLAAAALLGASLLWNLLGLALGF
jgi:hypothetical protein